MYCKHCGKQIDDDSRFCKECGKPINNNIIISNSFMGFFQKHLVLIALIVIWYIIGYLYSYTEYDIKDSGIIFGMYMVTPIIIGLLYWIYRHNCKYQIQFFNKTDSNKIKLVKYCYIAYTYFIPFSCSDGLGQFYFEYFFKLSLVWLVPTLIICGIYYYTQSKKTVK